MFNVQNITIKGMSEKFNAIVLIKHWNVFNLKYRHQSENKDIRNVFDDVTAENLRIHKNLNYIKYTLSISWANFWAILLSHSIFILFVFCKYEKEKNAS